MWCPGFSSCSRSSRGSSPSTPPGPRRLRGYGTSLVFFGCALLSKALAVGLPVVLVVLDVYPLRRLGGARGWQARGASDPLVQGARAPRLLDVWIEKVPYVLMATVAAGLAIAATLASA